MSDSIHEIDDIANMLKHARKHKLEVEVVWKFAEYVREGEKDFSIAAEAALLEWDI